MSQAPSIGIRIFTASAPSTPVGHANAVDSLAARGPAVAAPRLPSAGRARGRGRRLRRERTRTNSPWDDDLLVDGLDHRRMWVAWRWPSPRGSCGCRPSPWRHRRLASSARRGRSEPLPRQGDGWRARNARSPIFPAATSRASCRRACSRRPRSIGTTRLRTSPESLLSHSQPHRRVDWPRSGPRVGRARFRCPRSSPAEALGNAAAEMLIGILTEARSAGEQRLLRTELIVRGSTAVPRQRETAGV